MPFPFSPAWVRIPFVATVAIAVVFGIDLATGIDGTARGLLRVAVIAAAALAAGVFFQRWSTVPARLVPHHVMAGLGLLGGALVASSAFGVGDGVFGNEVTASLGLVALVISLIGARATLTTSSGAT